MVDKDWQPPHNPGGGFLVTAKNFKNVVAWAKRRHAVFSGGEPCAISNIFLNGRESSDPSEIKVGDTIENPVAWMIRNSRLLEDVKNGAKDALDELRERLDHSKTGKRKKKG